MSWGVFQLFVYPGLTGLQCAEADRDEWNQFLAPTRPDRDSYFTATWLYTECYMYRRLKSIFESW